MERRLISSGTPWESRVGYSRAVRIGDRVIVSGTTATDDAGEVVGNDDPYTQTMVALSNIEDALEEAGATFEDVVRTRVYVTDIGRWEEVGRAHVEHFAEVRPATSMLEVRALIDPAMLVEIEAEAIISRP